MPEENAKTGQKIATATAATPVGKALKVSEYVTDPKKRKKTIWAIIGCGGCCLVPFVIGLVLGITVITSLCTSYFKVKPWLYVVAPVGMVATDIAGTDFVQSVYNKIPEFIRKVTPFSWFMQFAKNKTFFEKVCKSTSYGFSNYLYGCISGEAALLFPEDCDPEAMAQAIDTYIQNGWPNSPMNGKGAYMVEAARKAGINPFLMAAQAQKESQFGSDPNSAPQYFNPFGTTGRGPNNSRHGRFTTYTSWEQAMDDYAVNYIRRYIAVEGDKTLYDIISRYAPPSENDTNKYVQQVSGWMSKMFELAGCSPGNSSINCIEGSFFGNLIETAKSFIGKLTTYSQARRGDFDNGYCDCSSFVSKVLQNNGLNIPLLATGGMASLWDGGANAQVKPVMLPHATLSQEQLSQIQPGDIIIFGNAYTTNNAHVVIVQGIQNDTIYYIDCTSRGAGGVQLRNRSRTASSVWGVYRVVGG